MSSELETPYTRLRMLSILPNFVPIYTLLFAKRAESAGHLPVYHVTSETLKRKPRVRFSSLAKYSPIFSIKILQRTSLPFGLEHTGPHLEPDYRCKNACNCRRSLSCSPGQTTGVTQGIFDCACLPSPW